MVALFSPNIPFLPGAANSVFMVPCVAVTNVMASMVYRQLKLGILRQDPWNESRQQSTHTLRGGLRFIRLTSPTVR
ncbi:hypothetical protein PHLCEN_2v6774 [Hermanssonia centrifuga]|uniref:Uncharacterized protein n=1 Tax=Hermanssonia centrifuga TaxID=98765 RepID=A0A2R6NZ35_9APHY|nr:hypothetical protein PHLCEN_2v6774 [Hermanssonia centrifuga]